MARTHYTEILPEERKKANQVLTLLLGDTVESAETVLLYAQRRLGWATDKVIVSEELLAKE